MIQFIVFEEIAKDSLSFEINFFFATLNVVSMCSLDRDEIDFQKFPIPKDLYQLLICLNFRLKL